MPRTPEDVLAAYFAHMSAEEYRAAADLSAPICIERFMKHEAPHMRPPPQETFDEYAARNSSRPREVSEHFYRLAQEHPRPALSDFFAGVESEQALASLDDREVYARHLQASDPGHRYRRMLDQLIDRHPRYADQVAELRSGHDAWKYEILGSVESGDRVAVLFESPLGGTPAHELHWEPTPRVAVLRRTDDGWRLATDPNPYAGLGMIMGPVPVIDDQGKKIWLDLSDSQ